MTDTCIRSLPRVISQHPTTVWVSKFCRIASILALRSRQSRPAYILWGTQLSAMESSLINISSSSLSKHIGLQGRVRSSGSFARCSPQVVDISRSSLLQRSVEFSGLKMSTADGVTRRVRDPKIAANEGKEAAIKGKNYVSATVAKPGVKPLLIAVGIPLVLGLVDSFFNSPSSKWFADLKKPWWEPPGPIFGGAWGILYPLMGLASYLVWAEGGFHKEGYALGLYVVQLVLNLLWPVFFFGWKNLGLALFDIFLLIAALAATINAFKPINQTAANLLKPYLAWVVFATLLNFNLWLTNRGNSGGADVGAGEAAAQ